MTIINPETYLSLSLSRITHLSLTHRRVLAHIGIGSQAWNNGVSFSEAHIPLFAGGVSASYTVLCRSAALLENFRHRSRHPPQQTNRFRRSFLCSNSFFFFPNFLWSQVTIFAEIMFLAWRRYTLRFWKRITLCYLVAHWVFLLHQIEN